MARRELRDDQWDRISGLLPGKATDRGVTAKDNRLFVDAVLWIARTAGLFSSPGVVITRTECESMRPSSA